MYKVPILYSFRRCPFAIRARAAIYFSNVKVELREVVLRNKPKEMLKVSKKGTVPILVTSDNILDESIDIIIWALDKSDRLNLLKPYNSQKKKVIEFISKIDNEFKYHLDRYKYSNRYQNDFNFKGKLAHRELASKYLFELEKTLVHKESTYLFDNNFSIVDLCIFPLVRQFKIADEKWFANNPKLIKLNLWLNNIIKKDFFNAIMKKYNIWEIGNSPEFFLNSNYN